MLLRIKKIKIKNLIFVFLSFLALLLTSCQAIKTNSKTIFCFDTVVNITLYNDENASKHIDEISEICYEISRYASDYNSFNSSSTYDLNTNRSIKTNQIVKEMLESALRLKDDTNGYFNPFIGNISRIWKKAIEDKALPNDEDIKTELIKMNNTTISITDDNITLVGNGNIDLGAYAKGYAGKKIKEYLEANNIKYYLIDLGNSLMLCGSKVEANLSLGLKIPNTNKYFAKANVKDICASTSSSEYQYFIADGNKYHHIVSPFTGYPLNNYDEVCVFSNKVENIDAYSTAIYLMDKDTAVKFAEDKKIDLVLYKEKIIYKSSGCDYIEEI